PLMHPLTNQPVPDPTTGQPIAMSKTGNVKVRYQEEGGQPYGQGDSFAVILVPKPRPYRIW
ncbi:MAG: hypothetical protein WKF36_06640, partial [Candidatus Nitrosocosmicus sp.]